MSMTAYWIESAWILLPGLLLMSVSAVPAAIGTVAALRHLRKQSVGPYIRNLWAGTAAGFVALGLLAGSLFGSDLSKSSTAGLIFVFVPIYAGIALGAGYGIGVLAHRTLARLAAAAGRELALSAGLRLFAWVPVALLGVLMLGIVKYSVQHGDMAMAERASNPEILQTVYARMERGEADAFAIPLFLAQNPNAPAGLLAKMSKHDHHAVRIFVVNNPNTEVGVIEGMKHDCVDHVRRAVGKRLKLPPGPDNALQPASGCGVARPIKMEK